MALKSRGVPFALASGNAELLDGAGGETFAGVTNVGKPSEVYYLVRLGKTTTQDDLITAIRAKAGDRVSAVEVELGAGVAKAQRAATT